MICPDCELEHRLSDGMTCACGRRFVFNPNTDRGMTDFDFVRLIELSCDFETHFFTANQLYAQFCKYMGRRRRARLLNIAIWLFILAAATGLIAFHQLWREGEAFQGIGFVILVAMVLTALGSLALIRAYTPSPAPRIQFDGFLGRWRAAVGLPEKLITHPELDEPPPEWNEETALNHSFERLMIVERDVLVDLFVKNGFLVQEATLVVSMTGYPWHFMPVAEKMLEDDPDRRIFILHDSTDVGRHMPERVRSRCPLPVKGHPVTDLGVHPADMRRAPLGRFMRLDREHFQAPVDIFPWPVLQTMIESALMMRIPMIDAWDRREREDSMEDSGFGFE